MSKVEDALHWVELWARCRMQFAAMSTLLTCFCFPIKDDVQFFLKTAWLNSNGMITGTYSVSRFPSVSSVNIRQAS